jgi:hypothetical protein
MRLLLAVFLALPIYAQAQTCGGPQTQAALAGRLVDAALAEYRSFPGHRIDAQGRIWKFGAVESEAESLTDPATGKPDPGQPGRVAWRRVWQYWQTLAGHEKGSPEEHQLTAFPSLLDDPAARGRPQRVTVAAMLERLQGLDPTGIEPVRQAIVRAAIVDTPWSAAFISYLMHQAGMTDAQFAFSATHANYIRAAFEQPDGYAYRACDPRTTAPRTGDLICYSRDREPLVGYAAWRDAVPRLGNGVKSHCDLVVAVDRKASRIETIGGNVLQSVSMRKLKLNAAGTLSRSYQAEHYQPKPGGECARDVTCRKDNLSVQYWGVLLQLR